MAKKGSSSSRRGSQTPEKNVVVEKDKSYSTIQKPVGEGKAENRKSFGSEIDEIFSGKKRKKPETGEKVSENKAVISVTKKKKKSPKKKPTKDIKGPLDMPAGQRKRTKDGLVVYTEEELGFGKSDAGGTRLCPFDCDCCF
ncbi:Nucleolar protein 56-like [Heracleum sosnowskyi]|uniref:Nucleolar protein 56-like n=1 Tax=Heracleum sosnowskyi TaxID=360622 RepID=A0AAD8ME16_9APIA|nr:Nucleolar protein 56-like [Heracleum sosnowskyi]